MCVDLAVCFVYNLFYVDLCFSLICWFLRLGLFFRLVLICRSCLYFVVWWVVCLLLGFRVNCWALVLSV